MSAIVADIVGEHLAGQRRAAEIISNVRGGTQHPDLLDFELQKVVDKPNERRGMLRLIQKHLEQSSR